MMGPWTLWWTVAYFTLPLQREEPLKVTPLEASRAPVALMIDRVHLADHLCVVGLGVWNRRTKHPLGGYGASEGPGRQFTCLSQYSSLAMLSLIHI